MTPPKPRTSRATIVATALATAITVSVSVPAAQENTFRATADAVTVEAAVQIGGRPVSDLTAGEFQIFDNGVPQQVREVSYGKLPIDVTVGLDISHSVDGPMLTRLREAVSQLMRDLGNGDRLKLMLVNMRISRPVDFTTDVSVVERAIREAQPGGGTTLFDAVSTALISAPHQDRRQLLMFFSDGADSISVTAHDVLMDVARRTTATLSVVKPTGSMVNVTTISGTAQQTALMMTPSRPALSPSQPMTTLSLVAAETGGRIIPAPLNTDLGSTFRQVLDAFRTTYVLQFSPTGVARPGFHTLDVKVTRANVVVKARRGYFGG